MTRTCCSAVRVGGPDHRGRRARRPPANDVIVRLHAAGLCHSDDHADTGDIPMPLPLSTATRAPASSRPSAPTSTASQSATTSPSRSCPPAAPAAGARPAGRTSATLARPYSTGMMSHGRETPPRRCTTATVPSAGRPLEDLHRAPSSSTSRARQGRPRPPVEVGALVCCGVPTGWGSATGTRAHPATPSSSSASAVSASTPCRVPHRGPTRHRRRPGEVQAEQAMALGPPTPTPRSTRPWPRSVRSPTAKAPTPPS